MAADLQKMQKFNTSKVKAYTVHAHQMDVHMY